MTKILDTLPKWYVSKTLLGCGPDSDINRRIIYHNMLAVATFNYRMHEWHEEDSEALQKLCNYLNALEAKL